MMTDKQIEAEARELHQAYTGEWDDWDGTSEMWKAAWHAVARKHRELADARYKPLVDAVEQVCSSSTRGGTACTQMAYADWGHIEALCRVLDNLKGGS